MLIVKCRLNQCWSTFTNNSVPAHQSKSFATDEIGYLLNPESTAYQICRGFLIPWHMWQSIKTITGYKAQKEALTRVDVSFLNGLNHFYVCVPWNNNEPAIGVFLSVVTLQHIRVLHG